MSQKPKTIQIFLPGGDPRGIRVAEITTRVVQVIEVPRNLLGEFFDMPESQKVALYVLAGMSDEGEPMVYIGQTSDLRTRLGSHDRQREFWQRVLVVVSLTNSLTQTHTLYLEWLALQKCREAGRFKDDNGNEGIRPHTPAPLEADCKEIFETADILLSTLGYPLFEPLFKWDDSGEELEKFYCTGSGADGEGFYTTEGFVVLKGSRGRLDLADSARGTYVETARERLLKAGVLNVEGNSVVFQQDHLFATPSPAASVLMARRANGWTNWRDRGNRTLDEIKRLTPPQE